MTLIISISMLSYPLVLAFPSFAIHLYRSFLTIRISTKNLSFVDPWLNIGQLYRATPQPEPIPKTNPKNELPKAPLHSVADCGTSSVAAKNSPALL